MLLHFGYAPTLIVSSSDMAREITKNHDIIFCNRPKSRAADIFFYGCKDIGFASYSEYSRQGRKVCVLELLSLRRYCPLSFIVARCILGRKLQEDDGLISSLKATFRELDPFLEEVIEDHKTDVNDMSKMEYLKCVFKETLRLHPPAALIYRETSEIVKLRGYDIPPKVMVLINSWAIHRDPNLWDRPEEFVPERFEKNPIDIKGLDFHYIPFGFGRRGCPGVTFGVFAVECLMANLLHWFDWKQPEELDMDEVSGFTVHKKNPLLLVPIPNSP
ncbi:hypothetical protein FEM48_Zijuj05G0066300 [Ziziphus jujuba var. spinosa]|uniref:Cytochrome P450 71A1-like n=1 Tax=Ziziphus jujuba var. spinosa TaxID=714518 RepID=A0A978VDE1_ZIZJJ|nr:hypothetical protein FEM48_Zijuj05G0066300 [Ziziphus jujuba var. spinosa]